MSGVFGAALRAAEQGWLPDAAIRAGMRRLLCTRLDAIRSRDCEAMADDTRAFIEAMRCAPVAPVPHLANEQHYEVPAAFFEAVLGPHRKYSSACFGAGIERLEEAEAYALELTCRRAGIEDGMRVLELGCGWGSLALWIAERFPEAAVTAVSNSASQRQYVEQEARCRGLSNVRLVTADMNRFDIAERFDRILSIEMFEHMRNYAVLFERIHGWLAPQGRFFMHIFCHRAAPYEFLDAGDDDWMSRHFFSGGIMPSESLPLRFQSHLENTDLWRWDGTHYQRTANAWLANMDRRRETVMPILAETYGAQDAPRWWARWRMFFMACAELFGYRRGQEWWVAHYLFGRRGEC